MFIGILVVIAIISAGGVMIYKEINTSSHKNLNSSSKDEKLEDEIIEFSSQLKRTDGSDRAKNIEKVINRLTENGKLYGNTPSEPSPIIEPVQTIEEKRDEIKSPEKEESKTNFKPETITQKIEKEEKLFNEIFGL